MILLYRFSLEKSTIKTTYDHDSGAFIVRLPEYTTFAELEFWGENFQRIVLKQENNHKSGLVLDTNSHNFESVACLKFLQNFLKKMTQLDRGINKIAFVQPIQYRQPQIVSSNEAYFSTFEDAYQWIRQ